MVARPWLNSEGKPLLIGGTPLLCEECPCGGVFTFCCQSYDDLVYPDGGFLRVPDSAVIDANCTFPDFSNLIVEVNGHLRFGAGACDGDGNGSYSVPNNSDCLTSGISPGGSCTWTGRFNVGCTVSAQAWYAHVMVTAQPGALKGWFGFIRSSATCSTNNISLVALLATFQLNFTAMTIPDLSGPVSIPCTSVASDSGGPYYDIAEPLVVYF